MALQPEASLNQSIIYFILVSFKDFTGLKHLTPPFLALLNSICSDLSPVHDLPQKRQNGGREHRGDDGSDHSLTGGTPSHLGFQRALIRPEHFSWYLIISFYLFCL